MALLDQTKRVELDGGEWVDVRQLSVGALRTMRRTVAQMTVQPGEDEAEVQGFELTRLALEACIVAWSDPAPVTPENIDKLPYKVIFDLTRAVGLGEDNPPLSTGPTSTAS